MLIANTTDNVTRLINPEAISYAEYRHYDQARDNEVTIVYMGGEKLIYRGTTAVLIMEMIEPFISKVRPEVG